MDLCVAYKPSNIKLYYEPCWHTWSTHRPATPADGVTFDSFLSVAWLCELSWLACSFSKTMSLDPNMITYLTSWVAMTPDDACLYSNKSLCESRIVHFAEIN